MDWTNEAEIAFQYMPVVVHGIHNKQKDSITAIYFGDLLNANLEPRVYYEIIDKGGYKLIIYQFYHRLDWSSSKFWLIKRLDSHPFDFEGLVKCVDNNGNVLWVATRNHYELLFKEGDTVVIYIEPESHAIRADIEGHQLKNQTILTRLDFIFVNMRKNWSHFESHIWPIFRRYGIDQWRDWSDWRIERKFGLRTIGLIHKNPAKLYRYAKKCLIVKGE